MRLTKNTQNDFGRSACCSTDDTGATVVKTVHASKHSFRLLRVRMEQFTKPVLIWRGYLTKRS